MKYDGRFICVSFKITDIIKVIQNGWNGKYFTDKDKIIIIYMDGLKFGGA